MGGAHIFQLLMGPNSEAAIRSRDGGFGSSEKACHCRGHYGALRVAVHPPGVLSLAITIAFLQKGPQSWAPHSSKLLQPHQHPGFWPGCRASQNLVGLASRTGPGHPRPSWKAVPTPKPPYGPPEVSQEASLHAQLLSLNTSG